ncbi:MAG: 6-phosphofructokinase [bacterium]
MNKQIKSIAVLTTGGDAPGMNTAIRAVVRTGVYHGLKVWGVKRGWSGLINGLIEEMSRHSVSDIVNRGGTMLHTKRCPEFREKVNRAKAYKNMTDRGIDACVVIGGDGSMRASHQFAQDFKVPINVIPATIDNDIAYTDFTIGFDTAVNTALEAIDKIRDTAHSHERLFVIEVMGRHNGFIALDVGLSAGAEAILIPEIKYDINKLIKNIKAGQQLGKNSFIIVVAEGAGDAIEIGKKLQAKINLEVRVTKLGYMQRGGTPTSFSRELACKLGASAVESLINGKSGYLIGAISDSVQLTPLTKVFKAKKKIDMEQLRIAEMLAS